MKPALTLCALLLFVPFTQAAPVEDSVVKVFATVRFPNPLKPWTPNPAADVNGSGTVIAGNRILTNAHLVAHATEVQVQPRQGGAKIDAKVELVAPDMDLAVLSVKDARFFEKCPPLPRAETMPRVQDAVVVFGYPVGGKDLAVTNGTISRIEFGRYPQQGVGLQIQISAAINPGNSGGPATVGGKMIGLVFSRLREQQNIGLVIPNEEIDHVLAHSNNGRFLGKPMDHSGTVFQRCENPAMRAFLKLEPETHGLVIIPPRPKPAHYTFQEFDLLTKIGEYDIDSEGMIRLKSGLRVSFYAAVTELVKDNAVPVTVLRAGKRVETTLPVSVEENRLVAQLHGAKLPYFIHGPLVFAPARADALPFYAQLRPDLSASDSPLFARFAEPPQFPGEELVVVTSPFLKHKITKGYEEVIGQVLTDVNGTRVKNLAHLVELLRDSKAEFLTFRFAERTGDVLVFRREEIEKVTPEILEESGISLTRRGSEEVLKLWKPAP